MADRLTPVFRQCCDSYLNHYGAVSILDALNAEDIEEIAFELHIICFYIL